MPGQCRWRSASWRGRGGGRPTRPCTSRRDASPSAGAMARSARVGRRRGPCVVTAIGVTISSQGGCASVPRPSPRTSGRAVATPHSRRRPRGGGDHGRLHSRHRGSGTAFWSHRGRAPPRFESGPSSLPGRGGPVTLEGMGVTNAVVAAVLRSPLHRLLSGSTDLIRYRARQSGKEVTTPTQYARRGDEVVILVGESGEQEVVAQLPNRRRPRRPPPGFMGADDGSGGGRRRRARHRGPTSRRLPRTVSQSSARGRRCDTGGACSTSGGGLVPPAMTWTTGEWRCGTFGPAATAGRGGR